MRGAPHFGVVAERLKGALIRSTWSPFAARGIVKELSRPSDRPGSRGLGGADPWVATKADNSPTNDLPLGPRATTRWIRGPESLVIQWFCGDQGF